MTVRVVDRDGNLCPDASHEISFKVKGEGSYRAGANGNAASLESFQRPKMKVFSGMMTAIVSSTEQPGKITLEATGKGLKKGVRKLRSKKYRCNMCNSSKCFIAIHLEEFLFKQAGV